MTSDTTAFLRALSQGRTAFVGHLGACGVGVKCFADDHAERPGAIEFKSDEETWLAEFYANGNFRQLVWG